MSRNPETDLMVRRKRSERSSDQFENQKVKQQIKSLQKENSAIKLEMKDKLQKFQELCEDYEQEIQELERQLGKQPTPRNEFQFKMNTIKEVRTMENSSSEDVG